MSSLPTCFFEQDHRLGDVRRLASDFPPADQRIAPGAVLHWGNCVVEVRAHDVWITRGADRLRVPSQARLYRQRDRLTLIWVDGQHAEIRRYCRAFDAIRCPPQSFPR